MTTEQIQQGIIDKILLLDNKDLLLAIDTLVGQSVHENDVYKVSFQQRQVLQASEEDIKYNRLISDEEVNQEEDLWLNK
jgi:hypothetical protein